MSTIHEPKPNAPSPIQITSSPSMKVFWLDLNQVRKCLGKAVERLAATHPEIEEVWLFGSLARGDAVPGSDADLLMVVEDTRLPFLERSVRYQPGFCGVGVDVLAYTRAELSRMQASGTDLYRQAQTEGVCLFRRSVQA